METKNETATKKKEAAVNTKLEAPDAVVEVSKRCDTDDRHVIDDRYTHPKPNQNEHSVTTTRGKPPGGGEKDHHAESIKRPRALNAKVRKRRGKSKIGELPTPK